MIIGKNSAKIGFSWYGRNAVKLICSGALIACGAVFTVIGVMLLGITGFEALEEWNRIKTKK